jgi:transcriptional regulator GlxA family with amidase domain
MRITRSSRAISNNLGYERLNVDLLAQRVAMRPRNFARSYNAKTGRTPAKAVEVFRLEAARRLLEETEQGGDRIARSCGFSDEERMRIAFQPHLAISIRDYRDAFRHARQRSRRMPSRKSEQVRRQTQCIRGPRASTLNYGQSKSRAAVVLAAP